MLNGKELKWELKQERTVANLLMAKIISTQRTLLIYFQ